MGNVVAMTDAVLEFDWVEVEVATAMQIQKHLHLRV